MAGKRLTPSLRTEEVSAESQGQGVANNSGEPRRVASAIWVKDDAKAGDLCKKKKKIELVVKPCQSIERVMEGGSEEEKDLPFHLAFGLLCFWTIEYDTTTS
jgi:hypothetical protein